jgi:GxxExxY protein
MPSISFSILKDLAAVVYAKVGPWASESMYQNALKYALIKAGFAVESERDIPVEYDGMSIGTVRADLVVAKALVVELKAVSGASKTTVDTAVMQCRHDLRLTGIAAGAVVVFPQRNGQEVFCREVTLADPESETDDAAPHVTAPNPFDDDSLPEESKKGAMSEEAKASMAAKRKKGPMSEEKKAAMAAKRKATIARKAAIAEARAEANEN